MILQDIVKWKKRRRDGQKRLEDSIKEQTGTDFTSITRASESRTRWKRIFLKLSLYHNDLARLGDRLDKV